MQNHSILLYSSSFSKRSRNHAPQIFHLWTIFKAHTQTDSRQKETDSDNRAPHLYGDGCWVGYLIVPEPYSTPPPPKKGFGHPKTLPPYIVDLGWGIYWVVFPTPLPPF